MIEEVYDFLREYGFTKEEVNYFEDENDYMYFTNMIEVVRRGYYFEGKVMRSALVITTQ